MVRRQNGRRVGLFVCTLLTSLAIALPALAQGGLKGSVKDDKGQPVEGAKVAIDSQASGRHLNTTTDKKGEFIQLGLGPGEYRVTAVKDKMGAGQLARVRAGLTAEVNLVMIAGGAPVDPKEAAARNAEMQKVFEAGVEASNAGRPDEAILNFTHGLELNPNCYQCYYSLGSAYSQKKEYDKAEESFKKALEIKADYAEPYSGLAGIYNAQHKFDQAAAAGAKATELSAGGAAAGGGGNPDILYNQGVIAWNAGKVAEAKKAFESAVAADPNHAESHYQLGMVLVNEGNLPGAAGEFETYVKLAPNGPNAAQAKALVAQLKK